MVLNGDGDTEVEREDPTGNHGLVMKLVRYALACEFGRVPIKREGIREKGTSSWSGMSVLVANAGTVFGKHSGRKFQQIFDQAQDHLVDNFGMQMVELPSKEKITLKDRRGMLSS